MPSVVEERHELSGNCQGSSHCLESGHPEESVHFLKILGTSLKNLRKLRTAKDCRKKLQK